MTIPRQKQSPRSTGRGRPKKASAPPPATGTTNVLIDLFDISTLHEITSEAKLLIADSAMLPQIVNTLNEAFSNFANSAAMKVNDSPPSKRRDWCSGLAKAVDDLQTALGYSRTSLYFEQSSFDANEILAQSWPVDPQSIQERERRSELISALKFVLPEKYPACKGDRSDADIDGDLLIVLARLGPTLQIVSSLAQAARDALSAETAGSDASSKERGRSYLMERVVLAYACLFGNLPTASPKSAGHRWVATLIMRAGQVAGELLKRPVHDESPEQRATTIALRETKSIADHIQPPPYKTASDGTAKLDHWIRDANRELKAAKGEVPAKAKR